MKKILSAALVCILLVACGSEEPEMYVQSVLPEPDRIEVVSGASTIVYENNQEQYGKILDAISANWWKTTADGAEEADDSELIKPESLKQLKTTSDRTYLTPEDRVVVFIYSTPMRWTVSAERELEIGHIKFVLPDKSATQLNVRGFCIIEGTDGGHEGMHTYYYRPELAGAFWEYLKH